jgi:hypothetical protein
MTPPLLAGSDYNLILNLRLLTFSLYGFIFNMIPSVLTNVCLRLGFYRYKSTSSYISLCMTAVMRLVLSRSQLCCATGILIFFIDENFLKCHFVVYTLKLFKFQITVVFFFDVFTCLVGFKLSEIQRLGFGL